MAVELEVAQCAPFEQHLDQWANLVVQRQGCGERSHAAQVETCTGVSTTRRTLFSNGSWSLANQIVRVGTLALVTIALSRHFGPQAFGALAVGLALVRIFAVIGTFGLDRVVVRRVAAEEAEADAILWTAFRLKLLIAFISYLRTARADRLRGCA